MIDTNPFEKAVTRAGLETSRLLSAHMRSEARASGWPDDLTSSLHVSFTKNSFNVNVHKSHYEKAMDLEYGTPDTQPTAAIRRVMNRTNEAETFFIGRLSRLVDGAL